MNEIRQIDSPAPGYWAIKLVRNGPEVAAAIFLRAYVEETDADDARMERTPYFEAFIDGRQVPVDQVWLRRGRVIPEAEYRYLLSLSAWARDNAPNEPIANPKQAVDLNTLRPIF